MAPVMQRARANRASTYYIERERKRDKYICACIYEKNYVLHAVLKCGQTNVLHCWQKRVKKRGKIHRKKNAAKRTVQSARIKQKHEPKPKPARQLKPKPKAADAAAAAVGNPLSSWPLSIAIWPAAPLAAAPNQKLNPFMQ